MVREISTRRLLMLAVPGMVMFLVACVRMFDGSGEGGGGDSGSPADQSQKSDLVIGGAAEIAKLSEQSRGEAAFNGSDYLVVWRDREASSGQSFIFAQRLSQSGAAVGARLKVAEASPSDAVGEPEVATLGGGFLVTWRRETGAGSSYAIQAQRISASGSLQGSVIDVQQTDGYTLDEPGVAASDQLGTFIVSWREQVTAQAYRVRDRPISPTGALGEDHPVSGGNSFKDGSSISAGSTTFLVTWSTSKANGRVVSKTGEQLVPIFSISDTKGSVPHSAFDTTNFLAVWQDERDKASTGTDIYGQRVTAGGALVGTLDNNIPISTAAKDQTSPRVTFCGGKYLVVFADARNGASSLFMQAVATDGSLVGASADKNTLLYAGPTGSFSPSVTCAGAKALVTWVESVGDGYSLKLLLVSV